jgi:hypothetical protein
LKDENETNRPREFLFLQHQGRSGPVRGSGEGDSEIFWKLILSDAKAQLQFC